MIRKVALEKEIATVDPGGVQFRLLDKLLQLVTLHAKLAKPRWRVHPQHGADLASAEVEIELSGEIRIRQTVAIGDREMLGSAKIARRRSCNARAGHRQFTGIRERHFPVAAV